MAKNNDLEETVYHLTKAALVVLVAVPLITYKYLEAKSDFYRKKTIAEMKRPILIFVVLAVISLIPFALLKFGIWNCKVLVYRKWFSILPIALILSANFVLSALMFATVRWWLKKKPERQLMNERVY